MKKIPRDNLSQQITTLFKSHKIVGLTGPRQVGKTTLAKYLSKNFQLDIHFFDLEDPTDEALLNNPKLALEKLEGLIMIDEIQRKPELFTYLRVKADLMKSKSRILILGSSSRDLIEKASESLAGRIAYLEVPALSLTEVDHSDKLFYRGGYPSSFLSTSEANSFQWRKSYLQSYIERDLRDLGIDLNSQTLRRFLEMCAGYHGQIFNASELGKSIGLSHTTVRKYLDILKSTFLVRELKPWSESILQRQVKQPKIYIKDVGLLYVLLGIQNKNELLRNPRLGSFWEGFALDELIKCLSLENDAVYFWALHQVGEMDLFTKYKNKRLGFEFKYTDKPRFTKSMQISQKNLNLDFIFYIYPGDKISEIQKNVFAVPLNQIQKIKAMI